MIPHKRIKIEIGHNIIYSQNKPIMRVIVNVYDSTVEPNKLLIAYHCDDQDQFISAMKRIGKTQYALAIEVFE